MARQKKKQLMIIYAYMRENQNGKKGGIDVSNPRKPAPPKSEKRKRRLDF